jgi:hypothetical protein
LGDAPNEDSACLAFQSRIRRADGQCCKGRIDVVGVDKLDRLGRSLQHLAQLISEFERHSAALVATSREIDTSKAILPAIADAYSCCRRRILTQCRRRHSQVSSWHHRVCWLLRKAVGSCILLSAQSLTFMTAGNALEQFLTESLTNIVQISYNDRCSRC